MAVVQTEIVSEEEYRRLALDDPQGQLELYRGQLREKPWMTARHGDVMMRLTEQLLLQLDRKEFHVRVQHARLRVSSDTYYVPDIAVIPTGMARALLERATELDAYPAPLPLIIEIWSPSTGDFDLIAKLPDYQRRGDFEIWFVHPQERTLRAWRKMSDGSYEETVYRDGIADAAALPEFAIDVGELFAGY
jgi:Uma2 family endonuclease